MQNQENYYINVYYWRDLPQGVAKVWTPEAEGIDTLDKAIDDHNYHLSLHGDRIQYIGTHTNSGKIDLREVVAFRDENDSDKEVQPKRAYLAPLA